MKAMDKGNLRRAAEYIESADRSVSRVRHELAALPSIRAKERMITGHLQNLNRANSAKAARIELAIGLAAGGKLADADSILDRAITTRGTITRNGSQSLRALVHRLQAQDFDNAEEIAKGVVEQLPSDVPLSADGQTALNGLNELVQRERKQNFEAQRRIAAAVRPLISQSWLRESGSFRPVLRGKAMIWDATKKDVERAYELLPDDLRASSLDGVVTVFSIVSREQILVGRYSISGQPGYKERMQIGVVYWPDRESPGTVTLWGGDPPGLRPVQYSPGYGSSVSIRDWISSLPRLMASLFHQTSFLAWP
jgi:hypothetical protein